VAGTTVAPVELKRELGLRDLILFSFVGVCGTRGAAMAAQMGPGSVTLWVLATVFFFLPSAFAVARLSVRYPATGGIYIWTRETCGEWHGFLCFWIYWLGFAFTFTSALLSSASMTVYAFGSRWVHLAESRTFVFGLAMIALVVSIGANVVGLKFGKWLDNFGAICTYALCAAIAGTAVFVWLRRGSATPFDFRLTWDWQRINFFSQMAFALTGLEMAPILAGEIRRPERDLPLASGIVSPLASGYYIISTMALLVIIPADRISPLHGIAQSAFAAGHITGWEWISPATAILLFCASVGQLSVFGASAGRLPYAVGIAGLLPEPLSRVHRRWHTPYWSILLFGGLAAFFLLLVQAGETLRATYQIMTDMMAIGGLLPFVYMFVAAWRTGGTWSALSGAVVSVIALLCALVPTAEVHSVWLFEFKIVALTAALIVSGHILYKRSRRALL
jgi:amino acid transporter